MKLQSNKIFDIFLKMKNSKKIILIFFFIVLIFSKSDSTSADVILPNSHYVTKCIRIVNRNQFPNLIFIARAFNFIDGKTIISPIESDQCINIKYLYKAHRVNIYWAKKEEGTIIKPENLLLKDLTNIDGYYTENKNPVMKEIHEYSITFLNNEKPILYLSKQIYEYNDGRSPKIITYPPPFPSKTTIPKQTSTKNQIQTPSKSFFTKKSSLTLSFKSFFCFLKKIFLLDCSY